MVDFESREDHNACALSFIKCSIKFCACSILFVVATAAAVLPRWTPPQEKAKVDWGDVEAKAKREAMWLLEWRKQQVRVLFHLFFRHSPWFPFFISCLMHPLFPVLLHHGWEIPPQRLSLQPCSSRRLV